MTVILLCNKAIMWFLCSINFFSFSATGWLSDAFFISSTGWLSTTTNTSSTLYSKYEPHVTDEPTDGTHDAAKLSQPINGADKPASWTTDGPADATNRSIKPDVSNESHESNATSATRSPAALSGADTPTRNVRPSSAATGATTHAETTQEYTPVS